jgi:hypothetical protein
VQRGTHEPGDALAVGAAIHRRHRGPHSRAHVLHRLRAAVAERLLDDRLQLRLGELRGQVAADQLALGLLTSGKILAAGVAVGACGLQAPLALTSQHGQLVVRPFLGGLLKLGEDETERPDLLLFPSPHRTLEVGFDLLDYRHP